MGEVCNMENTAARLVIRGSDLRDLSFCVLGNLAFFAAAFTSDIPLAEKQIKGGHDCPLAVVSFWEHKRTWAVKNLGSMMV
jgi:hypothetical protein